MYENQLYYRVNCVVQELNVRLLCFGHDRTLIENIM